MKSIDNNVWWCMFILTLLPWTRAVAEEDTNHNNEPMQAYYHLIQSHRFYKETPNKDDMDALDLIRHNPDEVADHIIKIYSRDGTPERHSYQVYQMAFTKPFLLKITRSIIESYPVGKVPNDRHVFIINLAVSGTEKDMERVSAEVMADPYGVGLGIVVNISDVKNVAGLKMIQDLSYKMDGRWKNSSHVKKVMAIIESSEWMKDEDDKLNKTDALIINDAMNILKKKSYSINEMLLVNEIEVKSWTIMLLRGDDSVWPKALKDLEERNKTLVICMGLDDKRINVAIACAQSLGRLNDERALPYLINKQKLLKHTEDLSVETNHQEKELLLKSIADSIDKISHELIEKKNGRVNRDFKKNTDSAD